MANEQNTLPGGWSEPAKDPSDDPPVQQYANKVRSYAEKALANSIGEFKKYVVTKYIDQVVAGTNFVVKVDTGNGDDKFAHVQFFVSFQVPINVNYVAAKAAKKSDPLKSLIKQ